MQSTEIRAAIRQFLCLFDDVDRTVPQDEEALPYLLDQLAFAQHFVRLRLTNQTTPIRLGGIKWPCASSFRGGSRTMVITNVPDAVTKDIAESKCVVGDAIDDILDIGNDLLDVEWRWENTSEADALWHFQNSYSSHWQAHLRGLQFYLHSLRWEAA